MIIWVGSCLKDWSFPVDIVKVNRLWDHFIKMNRFKKTLCERLLGRPQIIHIKDMERFCLQYLTLALLFHQSPSNGISGILDGSNYDQQKKIFCVLSVQLMATFHLNNGRPSSSRTSCGDEIMQGKCKQFDHSNHCPHTQLKRTKTCFATSHSFANLETARFSPTCSIWTTMKQRLKKVKSHLMKHPFSQPRNVSW